MYVLAKGGKIMKIAVGCDHAGFPLKDTVIKGLISMGHEVADCGSYDLEPVDFPDIAKLVGHTILNGEAKRGILVCGTGVGASIAANKIPGIRASLCHDIYTAHQCVEHDDVNVITIGAQIIGPLLALELIGKFLDAEFSTEEEFRRRVNKLNEMDKRTV